MSYGKQYTMNSLQHAVKSLSDKLQEKDELIVLKREMQFMKDEHRNATEAIEQLQKRSRYLRNSLIEEKVWEGELALLDNLHLTDLINDLQVEIEKLRHKVESLSTTVTAEKQSVKFCFQTLDGGKQFSPAIRALYYTLLAEQVPPAKVSKIIKAVLKCFVSSVNVTEFDKTRLRRTKLC